MFTGIVQDCQIIQDIQKQANVWRVQIALPHNGYQPGDSILLHGICSTVTTINSVGLVVEYMPETVRLTNVNQWQIGQLIHVEAPATLQTPLSGWLVTGHVDTTVALLEQSIGMDYTLTFQLPESYAALVMVKGGITINGVNLTITAVTTDTMAIQLVPYTLSHTTLGDLRVGDRVNVEFDYIAKLAQRYWMVASVVATSRT